MKKITCYIKAIMLYLKTGAWQPHTYQDVSKERRIIITTKRGFRISNSTAHNKNEIVHPNAVVIKRKCKNCGYENTYWYDL